MPHPVLYQINARCWLRRLSDAEKRPVTLATVPAAELAGWRKRGFTHLWLMGVWPTGPAARAIALQHPELRREYDRVLPGWTEADVAGSPYSVAAYSVAPAFGGDEALQQFRTRLHELGLKLILDFVPNHLGVDHPWVTEQPDRFVSSPNPIPGTFPAKTRTGMRFIAHGKDPYFAPWTDVAQLDYRREATRQAMRRQLLQIAQQCDGVRCDMAMLLLNEVFEKTWARWPTAETPPTGEFWPAAIQAVKTRFPEFLFIAEVYWGLEGRLQAQGFDFTYDKAWYDDLMGGRPVEAQHRLLAHPPAYVEHSVHFLENHDEPRVAARLSPAENRAAALAILAVPGMCLLHQGQLTGARIKLPVQLGRAPIEPEQAEIKTAYTALLAVLPKTCMRRGQGRVLAPRSAWAGNWSHQHFLLVLWSENTNRFDLVVVNLSGQRSQCYAPLDLPEIGDEDWRLRDLLGEETYERVGSDLVQSGLYLDVPAHAAQIFRFEPKR